ncbi:MAG: FGGY family carbohydrate kinase [Nakamurella sp.]
MTVDELILAIDQGTGSSKALLVDRRGEIVAKGSSALTETHPRPGWVEQSLNDIWGSVQNAVSAALAGIDPARVAAVGLSTQRESLVLWDRRTGEPLGPLVSWQDQRTAADCQQLLDAGAGEGVRRISGLPLDPMFSATKARWLLDHADPDRTRSRRGELCLGTVDSWLLSRFGENHLIEIGNASRTQLLNVRERNWDPELLELFNVPLGVLPTVVPSTGPFPAVGAQLPGLLPGTPIAAVLGDSHAALFAHAAWRPGTVKATYGTGSSVMGLCDPNIEVGDGLCLTVAWQDSEPSYAVEGNIRSSGSTLVWLANLVGSTPNALAELAATADSDGVHLVPGFNGLGAPWWDRTATGLIDGLKLGTALPNLARAALESIVFQVEDVVAAVDHAVAPVRVLLADGGASANPVLMQLQADISGRKVERALAGDLSPLGAAHLAGRSIGLWSHDELEAFDRPRRAFKPSCDPDSAHSAQNAWHIALARARQQPAVITAASQGLQGVGHEAAGHAADPQDPFLSRPSGNQQKVKA